jgi:arylsulfatase A-like enzyme
MVTMWESEKNRVSRRAFVKASATAAAMMMGPCRVSTQAQAGVQAQGAAAAPGTRRPNVVLILADDLGYADLGCYGSTIARTPHLDKLAAEGVRFTDAYSTAPLCSPARAGLLTGRYQQRFGFEFNVDREPPPDWGITENERLISEDLKAAGYATGMVGKWHLGPGEKRLPVKRGFDYFYGFIDGRHRYMEAGRPEPLNPIMRGDKVVADKGYLTESFTREAIGFIEQHKAEPFFLYLSPNAVHGPLQRPPEQYYRRVAHIDDEPRRIFAATLAALDDQVGAIKEKLRQVGQLENTLFMFMSDNGGQWFKQARKNEIPRNAPLRGVKTELLEGGIRVPMIVSQPGKIAPAVKADLVNSLDLYPTFLSAAAAQRAKDQPELEGVNLMDVISGKPGVSERALFWRHSPEFAIRRGQWKLLGLKEESPKLFDLSADLGEEKDLVASEPKRAEELMEEWKRWDSKNIPAKWPSFRKGREVL